MRITFLLGAGASYGHIENPNDETPPIMSNFLSRAVEKGILTSQEFPELANECITRGKSQDLFQACIHLKKSGFNLESFLSNTEDLWTLQLSRFFLYRYLGEFCKQHIADSSAYKKLARFVRKHRTEVNGIISLNYDTLCESALLSDKIQINYALTPTTTDGLLFFKPHGSVNFRFPIGKVFIRMNVADWAGFLKSHNSIIETTRFSGQWVESYSPAFTFKTDFLSYTSIAQNRILEYIPALVPPLGRLKYYEQFDSYQVIWDSISRLLKQTDTLVVIGSKMNCEEFRLWDTINDSLPKTSLIKIVGSSLSGAEVVKDKFVKKGFERVLPLDTPGFYEYASRYLEADTL